MSGNAPTILFFIVFWSVFDTSSVIGQLNPGSHNTTPITGCVGFNPAALNFTTGPSGGKAPYTFQWQLNGEDIPGANSSGYDPGQLTAAGVYRYCCAVRDEAGDRAVTEAKIITIVPDPSVTLIGGGFICQSDSLILSASITGGTGVMAYQWMYSFDNLIYTTISGVSDSTYSPETVAVGIRYYKVRILPMTGSCNNAISGAVLVGVLAQPSTSAIYHY